MSNNENQIKITILGDEGVGKRTFLNSLKLGENKNHSIGLNIKYYNYQEIKNINFYVKIQILSSQERNKLITKAIYENNNGFIIIFDLNDIETYKNVNIWIKNIENYSHEKKYLKLIIGNKSDLLRITDTQNFDFGNKNSFYEEVDSLHNPEKCKTIIDKFIKNIYDYGKKIEKNYNSNKTITINEEEDIVNKCGCDCCSLL